MSEAARNYIVQNYPQIEPQHIEVIPRGVEPNEFPYGYKPTMEWLQSWQAVYPQLAGKRILTLPGRITRLKGHQDFIELIAQLRTRNTDIHGLIVGDEDPHRQAYAAELHRTVHDRGLDDAITFTGARNDIREIYTVSDLVLSLSTKPESFGRTVLEALCLGVPVVGYAHGGVSEILRALHPSGLVEPGNIRQLVDTVARMLETPAHVHSENPYTQKNMLRQTLALYEQAAASLKLTS